ncbi:unnamed protein product [Cercopithifilaria johnstoni]|uniref:Uncharacterized protein n=1 Tax=Cercopithifilaria johnstoni TaxID=2874296 RepID=A0A8J2M081_9BILA|nr:unnamed protein product [Cercopithifilaria johnstoni]
MSYTPYIQPSKPGQHPKMLNSSLYKKPSPTQSIPSTISKAGKSKVTKEIEDLQHLPVFTARTPSQKPKKDRKLSTEKDSQGINKIEVENDEEPQVQQYETDIAVSNNDRLNEQKQKKSKEKQKSEPERYHHQVPPDNVHEWINRIARSASPLPYFSPNKQVLLIPEPSSEDLGNKNDEENEENIDTLDTTGTNKPEKSTNSSSHTKAGEVETDVEISTETKEQITSATPTFSTPISSSVNAPPSSTFLDDQSYWRKENKQKNYLKIGNNSEIDSMENAIKKPRKTVLWNPPDKRAEARFKRTLENPW